MPWMGGIQNPIFSTWDWNNDGLPDLIAYDRGTNRTLFFRATDTIQSNGVRLFLWTEPPAQLPPIKHWAFWVDVTDDGKPELWTPRYGNHPLDWQIRILKNCSTSDTIRFCPWIDSLTTRDTQTILTNSLDITPPVDIDQDGDIDLIVFNPPGTQLIFYENLAHDSLNRTDTLLLHLRTPCFGKLFEDPFACEQYLDSCQGASGSFRHAGSTLAWLHLNNDTFPDLLLGDIICPWISAFFLNKPAIDSSYQFTSEIDSFPPEHPIILETFPAVFPIPADTHPDIDLITTPMYVPASWDHYNTWLYLDTCPSDTTCFALHDSFFLTRHFLDVGKGALPVWIDVNADGRTDLLIGTDQRKSPRLPLYDISIVWLRQGGSPSNPTFWLATWRWDSLYLRYPYHSPVLTFGDLDNDGDHDAILGEAQGNLFWLENTAGPNQPIHLEMKQLFIGNIDVGQNAHPVLWDVDGDQDLDLIVGNRAGTLTLLLNKGSIDSPIFVPAIDTFGGIQVRLPNTLEGLAAPTIGYLDTSGKPYLLVGSWQGWLYIYRAVSPCLIDGVEPIDTLNLNMGWRIVPSIGDINNDSIPEIAIGTQGGGIRLLTWGIPARKKPCLASNEGSASGSSSTPDSGTIPDQWAFTIGWQDPYTLAIHLQSPDTTNAHILLTITDILGRTLATKPITLHQYETTIHWRLPLSQGIYYLRIYAMPARQILHRQAIAKPF